MFLFHHNCSGGRAGGTAGVVVAARLTENPNISVLLVEAGNKYAIPELINRFTLNKLTQQRDADGPYHCSLACSAGVHSS